MVKRVADQAEGLRRLLAGRTMRVIALAAGVSGAGQTTVTLNLAAALARQGRDVLVLDETGGLADALALRVRHDLVDVCLGQGSPFDARTMAPDGFGVLAARPCRQREAGVVQPLACLADAPPDVVLIDIARDASSRLSPLAAEAHDLLVVLGAGAAAITDTYRWLKQAHSEHAMAQCRVWINRAGAADACRVADNLAQTAARYLGMSLALAGCLPADPLVARARQLRRTVIDAFPASAAATHFRQLATAALDWPLACAPHAVSGVPIAPLARPVPMTASMPATLPQCV